jgi:hypothetical protein
MTGKRISMPRCAVHDSDDHPSFRVLKAGRGAPAQRSSGPLPGSRGFSGAVLARRMGKRLLVDRQLARLARPGRCQAIAIMPLTHPTAHTARAGDSVALCGAVVLLNSGVLVDLKRLRIPWDDITTIPTDFMQTKELVNRSSADECMLQELAVPRAVAREDQRLAGDVAALVGNQKGEGESAGHDPHDQYRRGYEGDLPWKHGDASEVATGGGLCIVLWVVLFDDCWCCLEV